MAPTVSVRTLVWHSSRTGCLLCNKFRDAASLISEDSSWIVGQPGASCDAVCERLSEPCNVDSLLSMDTKLRFNRAVASLGVPFSCQTHIRPEDLSVPFIGGNYCALSRDSYPQCSGSSPTITRLCCCQTEGCNYTPGFPILPPVAYWPFDSYVSCFMLAKKKVL